MSANRRSGMTLQGSRLTAAAVAPKPPLTEQAYQTLRESILRGTIVAGERLKIDVLQRDLDVSSSPLREALNRLVAENLVVADERRGFRAGTLDRRRDLVRARHRCPHTEHWLHTLRDDAHSRHPGLTPHP